MMNKAGFLSFIALFLMSPLGQAKAAAYITYPDFVLMPKQQQYEVVHMVQDHVVEYEHQSRLLMQKNSRKTSYVDFLLAPAYASDVHGAPCMYAGWPSVMIEANGAVFCSNPAKYEQAIKRYESSNGSTPYLEHLKSSAEIYKQSAAEGQTQISYDMDENDKLQINLEQGKKCNPAAGAVMCNPLIFGKFEGKTMCVAAKADHRGYNASFLCERAVAKIRNMKDQPQKYTNLMDGIVKDVLSAKFKRSYFLNAMKDMYDMCLCSQDPNKNGRIHQYYADRMFYTRTCAGVLFQSKNILESIYQNQPSSCGVFETVKQGEDWVTFAQEAYANIKIETDNLTPEFVAQLEIKSVGKDQEQYIYDSREKARASRGGSFCPIEIEEPQVQEEDSSCTLAAIREDETEGVSILFSPSDGKKLEDYTFTPDLEFDDKGDDGLKALYTGEEKPEKFTATLKDSEGSSCAADFPAELDKPAEIKKMKCEIELSSEAAQGGHNIVAKVKADGEEVESEEKGYTVSFVNLSSREPAAENKTESANDLTDEMVSDAPKDKKENKKKENKKKEGKKKKQKGTILKKLEDNAFAAFVEQSEEEQEILAKLSGPDGTDCSAEKKITVSAPGPSLAPSTGPMFKKPQLIQPRRNYNGTFMRGNR